MQNCGGQDVIVIAYAADDLHYFHGVANVRQAGELAELAIVRLVRE
jgi:hypothetical protein